MSLVVERYLSELLQLSPAERGDLAARLLDSLEETDQVDADYEAAWEEEIRMRIEDVLTGRVQAVPLEEALKQIFAEDDGAD